jgi:deoxycytidine triphosphate deaminase
MTERRTQVPVGILCGDDIKSLIDEISLITSAEERGIQSCSYDMRIGTIFREGRILRTEDGHANEIIQPGEIVSVLTLEELNLPEDIAATAFAINSQSREGLMVLNPGHVDPGFKGPLSVKAINLRKVPLSIAGGDRIFTVIFEKLPKNARPYAGNVRRDERERDCNKIDLEVSPSNLCEMLKISRDCPFALVKDVQAFKTEAEVKQIVTDHWMSRLTLGLAAVAALAAIAGLIVMFTADSSRTIEHHYFQASLGTREDSPSSVIVSDLSPNETTSAGGVASTPLSDVNGPVSEIGAVSPSVRP